MTDTDRIAQMAREAGFAEAWVDAGANPPNHPAPIDLLQAFARLVAEDCAKVCDESADPHPGEVHTDAQWCALHLSAAIRSRYK